MSSRQSGTTTRQMLEAPEGAIYVWPQQAPMQYARNLQRHLGRQDLRLCKPSDLCMYRNTKLAIVVDHYAWTGLKESDLEELVETQKRSKGVSR